MARTGIQYSDVARAAAKLIADGKSPTVDSVRQTLGGTGSKSTIAPFLKRWKTEQEDTAIAEVTLPAPLLNAVRGLHEHMQVEFQQQREALELQHNQAIQTLEQQLKQVQTEKDKALAENLAVEDELVRTRQALADLQERFHTQNVTMAAMQAEHAGLQQRLIDRATEIATLDNQLSRAREQFSHYQEATAAQREADRREYERRIGGLEHDLITANREIAGLQVSLAQRESALSSLALEHGNLQSKFGAVRDELQTIQFARDRLQEQLEESLRNRDQASAQIQQLEQTVMESRLAAASQERETKIRADQLQNALAQIDALLQEKLTWVQKKTILEQQLGVAQQAILDHAAVRK
ncbi:DNA-binding protein [Noviherbaspirillum sp. CPCC 100848]|uniref:DNA-binding protein n=1 Tax=Noviherbaspirillum album TaxID=3080276 RepID=A0ABU6JGP7_9BURK|nr:DNA-binding protein [Noviherbaspirillum sp. CPCC 100848]MEC4722843.1 DNA-binding protein [Noviherbaspirillum sp. CPCC 100848]